MRFFTRIVSLATFAIVLMPISISSQELPQEIDPNQIIAPRILGNQIFQIDLGLLVPLFSYSTTPGLSESESFKPGAGLNVGGSGALRWSAFLDNTFAIGLDLSGRLAAGPNEGVFGSVLVGPRLSSFFRIDNFQIPVSISPGLSILAYKELSYVGFGLRTEAGFFIDATSNWSFGLNLAYTWLPEVYADANPIFSQSRVGNLLEITLSALYSF